MAFAPCKFNIPFRIEVFRHSPLAWQILCTTNLTQPKNSKRVHDEEYRASNFFHPCWSISRSDGVRSAANRDSRHSCFELVRADPCTRANGIRKDCFCGEEFFYAHRGTAVGADVGHSQDHEFQARQDHHHRWQLESWR